MANKFWIEVKKLAKKWSKIVEDPYYTMDDFVDCLNFRSRDNSVDEINDEFYDLCEKYGVKFYAPEDYRGGNMLELSDRHVMWEIEIPEGLDPEEAENIIEDHIKFGLHKFNDNHEIARAGLYGRGSRHVCVPFTEWNLEEYFDLRDDMEKTIDETIASINHALSYAATHQNESRLRRGRVLKENRTMLKVVSVEQIVLDCKTGEMLDGCDLQKRFVDAMVGRTFDGDENLVEYVVEEIFGLDYADKNLYDYMYNYEGDEIIVSACSRKDWCMEPVPEDDPRAYFEFQIHVGVDKILAERRR